MALLKSELQTIDFIQLHTKLLKSGIQSKKTLISTSWMGIYLSSEEYVESFKETITKNKQLVGQHLPSRFKGNI